MRSLRSVLYYLGVILIAFSVLQAAPLCVSAIYRETVDFPMRIYVIPAVISLMMGLGLVLPMRPTRMTTAMSMVVGTLGWVALSVLGAVPYWLALDIPYLDALFEAVSGFTTTGSTLFSGLQWLPKSILFWRALTQWIGGLGIFSLFLFVMRASGSRHSLLGAEAHKASMERFSPGVFSSLRILWAVYGGLTFACGILLWLEGLTPFDAIAHALTTISTGGFSTQDASIAYFAQNGYQHAAAIEITILVFMFLGGTSFLVLWHALRWRWRSVWRNRELRTWLCWLLAAVGLIIFGGRALASSHGWGTHIRQSFFHVISIATTTGFTLSDFPGAWMVPVSQVTFLSLMLIGGCIGSTAGGLKVYRLALLRGVLRHRLRSIRAPRNEMVPLRLGTQALDAQEIQRTAAVVGSWLGFLFVGWIATTLFSTFDGWEALSGITSALSNVGPSFISPADLQTMGIPAKLVHIFAMLAGRLEILPILVCFSRRIWK